MPEAVTDFQKLYVTCEQFSDRDLVGLVPGSKWREAAGRWELNLTWASAKQLRSIFGEDLILDETVIDWATQELERRINPCMLLRNCLSPADYPDIDYGDLDPRLYGYQVAGAKFLATARHGILSDPPGAGKTAQAVSAARSLNALPALVIAPKSTLVSWGREVEMWWPGTPVYVVDGNRNKRAELILESNKVKGFCIINWEAVRLHSRLAPYGSTRLRRCSQCDGGSEDPWTKCERCPKELNMVNWDLVIADEGHRMANVTSKQTRALWALGQGL